MNERFLIALIPLFFWLFNFLGNYYIAYKVDKAIKKQNENAVKIVMQKAKWFFAFYNRKEGEITKVSYRCNLRSYIYNSFYLLTIILFIVINNSVVTILGMILSILFTIGSLLITVIESIYYDSKYDIKSKLQTTEKVYKLR